MRGLKETWKKRTEESKEKAMQTIEEMVIAGKKINFSSVSKESGIAKSFLYDVAEIRTAIEKQRVCEINYEMNRRAKYEKTSRSKDVIIETKERRITKLEMENKRLKEELNHLRALLYEQK